MVVASQTSGSPGVHRESCPCPDPGTLNAVNNSDSVKRELDRLMFLRFLVMASAHHPGPFITGYPAGRNTFFGVTLSRLEGPTVDADPRERRRAPRPSRLGALAGAEEMGYPSRKKTFMLVQIVHL